jgi:hypothetical protein
MQQLPQRQALFCNLIYYLYLELWVCGILPTAAYSILYYEISKCYVKLLNIVYISKIPFQRVG